MKPTLTRMQLWQATNYLGDMMFVQANTLRDAMHKIQAWYDLGQGLSQGWGEPHSIVRYPVSGVLK